MSRSDKSLDEQIAEVEERLARRRAELRLLAAEARSRVSVSKSIPVAMIGALAVGFAASRFVRRPAPRRRERERDYEPRRSRSTRMMGAIAGMMLPPLIRPLQHAAADWLSERMRRSATR